MLSYSLIVFLYYNAAQTRRDQTILFSRSSLQILIYSIVISYINFDWFLLESGISLYGGLFHITCTSYIFHVFLLILSSIIIGLTSFYPRKILLNEYSSLIKLVSFKLSYKYITGIINKMGEQFRITEYSLILLFIVTGGILLMSTSDLVSIFLSIELQSYGLYLISTIYRNSESATAGGLTYFLLGGLSSCFILLSTSLLYANSGTSNLDNLYVITSISEVNEQSYEIIWYEPYYIHIGLIAMAVGFLFKISAAPFHFWSPDVYDGIPTIVTTFVAIIAKISIFIFLLQLVYFTNRSLFNYNWTIILLISSLLSLIIGSVLGLTQYRIKRLYAYSTISHVGFILLALSIQTVESIQSFVFYLIQYSVSNLNAFILLLAIGFTFYVYVSEDKEYENLKDKNNSPLQLISQLRGYFYINPILGLSLSITLFSFIGIPPLVGFFGKQMILTSALDNGYIFMSFIGILTSVISASYYLVIVKQIFFDKSKNYVMLSIKEHNFVGKEQNSSSEKKINFRYNNIVLSSYLTISISILTLSLTVFMFMHKSLLNICYIIALSMFYS